MDKPVILIEAPELDDEGVANVRAFLHEIALSFELHYRHRLLRYRCSLPGIDEFDEDPNDF
jgi:hypothetical protein